MNKGQQINILTKRAHADNTHLRPPQNRQSTLTDAND